VPTSKGGGKGRGKGKEGDGKGNGGRGRMEGLLASGQHPALFLGPVTICTLATARAYDFQFSVVRSFDLARPGVAPPLKFEHIIPFLT